MHMRFWLENHEGRGHLKDLDEDGSILKLILEK